MSALPAVRAEVVDELARVYVDRDVDPEADAAWSTRARWSTGDERMAALHLMLGAARCELDVAVELRAEAQGDVDRLTGGAS